MTWKRPVIIYNRAVGREQALRLKRRLQVLLDEEIGLYPCGKERSLEVPLPDDCTRIWLDSMYWYPKRDGHPDDYRVTIGDRRRTYRRIPGKQRGHGSFEQDGWETDAVVCKVGHGQASIDRAIDVLFEMLEPYVSRVGGRRSLRPATLVYRVIEGGPSFGEKL